MVSMATQSEFENEGMPTKVLISKLLLILDYQTKYQIKAYYSLVAYANNLMCIFINIYEIIKNVIHEWGYRYKINNISAAISHRILKFVLNSSLDIGL